MTDQSEYKQRETKPSLGWNTSVRYYLEDIQETAKLLELDVSQNLLLGRLKSLADKAKHALREISDQDVLIILSFGDWHISGLIEEGFQVRGQDGIPVALTSEILDRITRTDMMRVTLKFLSENEFSIFRSQEKNDAPLLITPIRFCAASALADAYRAQYFSSLEGHWSDIAGFHALQAAETVAMMRIFHHDEILIAPSLERAVFSQRAREGAAARLANDRDGKQAAKRQAHILWKEWKAGKHKKIRTVEQFAMEVMRRYPMLRSANVIRKWSTAWARELNSDSGDSAS